MFHVELNFSQNRPDWLERILSPELASKFDIYEQLLVKWQKSINLVSRETLKNIKERHFLDSLQLIPILQDIFQQNKAKILDLGSGGGFPGIVLALTERFDVTCIDSDTRKTIFLSEVARQTGAKVTIINDRIENILPQTYDIVTARAFAPLNELIRITKDTTKTGMGLFLKGKSLQREIDNAKGSFNFVSKIYPSITVNSSIIQIQIN